MNRRAFVLVALTAALSACASAGGGGASTGTLREEMGPAVPSAVERESVSVLERNGYRLLRCDQSQDRLLLETEWLHREPTTGERAAGVQDVRSRIIVTTRPRGTTNSAGQMVSGVTISYELQHLNSTSTAWQPATGISSEASAAFKQIANDIRQELQVKGLNG